MKLSLSQVLARFLTTPTVRIVALILTVISLAGAWPLVDAIQYDRRIEALLPQKEAVVQSFLRLRKELGGADAILVVWHEPRLMQPDGSGLKRLQTVIPQIRQLPETSGTLSLLELDKAIRSTRVASLNLFGNRSDEPPAIVSATDPLAADFRDMFSGYTHAPAGDWAGIAVLLKEGADHAKAITNVRRIMSAQCNEEDQLSLVGEPVLIVEGMKLLEEDGARLSRTVMALLSVTLLFILRSPRWVAAILVLVVWSRWMTRAILVMLDTHLTMVSGMLDAVVTVIAVAAAMHLALRHTQESSVFAPRDAARRMWQGLLVPVFWSLITTAVGFASLAVSEIVPVRQFGWMMALGTVCILVGIVVIFPAFAGPPQAASKPTTNSVNRWLRRKLLQTLQRIRSYPYSIVMLTIVLTVASLFGIAKLDVQTNFLKNFRSGSPLVRAYEVVEQQLGGAGVWDVMLPAPNTITADYLKTVMALESKLREVETPGGVRLTKVLSIADVDASVVKHSSFSGLAPVPIRLNAMRAAIPSFFNSLLSSDERPQRYLRVLLRSPERATALDKRALIAAIDQCVQDHVKSEAWQANFPKQPESARTAAVTGYYVLLSHLVAHLMADQWSSFLVASIGILISVWLAVRSPLLALLATIPSVLPILMVLGVMGFAGVSINLGAAMIAAVSVGLSIDGSIHYLYAYQRKLRSGRTVYQSLQYAQRSTGLPVTLATVALALGLLTLVTSPLRPTSAFGLLSGITMLAGLIGNLALLPALILASTKHRH